MHFDLEHHLQQTWPEALPMPRKAKVGLVDEDSKNSSRLPECSQQVLTSVRSKGFGISKEEVEVGIGRKLSKGDGLAATLSSCTIQGGGH